MNMLYVGQMGDAVNNLMALSKITSTLVFANTDFHQFYDEVPQMEEVIGKTCKVWNLYQSHRAHEKKMSARAINIRRFIMSFLGVTAQKIFNRDSEEARIIRGIIDNERIDVVFVSWGITVIPDILLIRSLYPTIPIIHHLPTFPTSYDSLVREKVEILLMRKVAHLIDGFVAGSARMKHFLVNECGVAEKKIMAAPIYYTSEFFAKKKLPRLSDSDGEPHLISTGSTKSSYACNNVAEQIISIAKSQIHVHCTAIDDGEKAGRYLHIFEGFNGLIVAQTGFVTQFDGCLVLYNVPFPLLRFEMSVPQRFLFCFTAGIPIFIPRGTFKSCEDIVETHRNGCVFDTIEQLNGVLRDSETMRQLRQNAEALQPQFTFEAQAEDLVSFITGCIGTPSGS